MVFREAWVAHLRRSCRATAVMLLCAACPAGDDAPATSGSTGGDDTSTGGGTQAATASASTSSSTTDVPTSTGPESTGTTDPESTSTDASQTGEDVTTTGCMPGSLDCVCDAGACDEGLECVEDVCIDPAACADRPDAEPNDDEASAIELGDVQCGTLTEMQGAVDSTDIDWWTYHGIDDGSCDEATIVIVNSDADEDLEVCMYFECDMGNAQVVCAAASSNALSPDGRPGCCGVGSTQYTATTCLGAAASDSGTIYMSVAGPEEPMCLAYDIAYRFLE